MSTSTALDQIKARAEGHTEGPWRTWQHGDGPRNSGVETTWACEDDEPKQITDWCFPADAELIAAAPKLLAALEAVEEMAGGMNCASKDHAYGTWDHGYNTALRSAATLIREVIEEALR